MSAAFLDGVTLALSDLLRGVARDDGTRRHIGNDNTSRADNSSCTDGDAPHDNRVRQDTDAIPYYDGLLWSVLMRFLLVRAG